MPRIVPWFLKKSLKSAKNVVLYPKFVCSGWTCFVYNVDLIGRVQGGSHWELFWLIFFSFIYRLTSVAAASLSSVLMDISGSIPSFADSCIHAVHSSWFHLTAMPNMKLWCPPCLSSLYQHNQDKLQMWYHPGKSTSRLQSVFLKSWLSRTLSVKQNNSNYNGQSPITLN